MRDTICSVPVLTNAQAFAKATGDSGATAPDHVCGAGVLSSRVSVLRALRWTNIARPDAALNDEDSDQGIDKRPGDDILQSRVEDNVVPFFKGNQLLSAFALVTISEMVEIGVEVHVLTEKMLWQRDAKSVQSLSESRIRSLHSWMHRVGFRDGDVDILSRYAVHWASLS